MKLFMNYQKTYQSPTMAPFCEDNEKYEIVEKLVNQIKDIKENKKNRWTRN